jgi:hypothetical protein
VGSKCACKRTGTTESDWLYMKQIWTDRRLFLSVLCVVASCYKVESAAFVAAIFTAYAANRAYIEGKK